MNRTRTLNSPCFMPNGWSEFTKDRQFKDSPLEIAVWIARKKLKRFDIIVDDVAAVVFEAFAAGKVDFDMANSGRAIRYAAELIKYAILDEEGVTSLRQEWPTDDKGNQVDFPSPSPEQHERWRTAELSTEMERLAEQMRLTDTAEMALKIGLTQRRAQQILQNQIDRANKNGDLFGEEHS